MAEIRAFIGDATQGNVWDGPRTVLLAMYVFMYACMYRSHSFDSGMALETHILYTIAGGLRFVLTGRISDRLGMRQDVSIIASMD